MGLKDARLASGGSDGKIRLWSKDFADKPDKVLTHDGGTRHFVNALAVFADQQLASGGDDGTIKIWPQDFTDSPEKVLTHGGEVSSLAVLADGRLASGGKDGKIRLWPKAGTGEPVVLTHGGEVSSLAVLKDGRLASGGGGKIKLWIVDDEKLIAALCLRAGRNFTKDEWARYIGPDTPWHPSCGDRPSNWRTVDEEESRAPASNNAPAEAHSIALTDSGPPAKENVSPAPAASGKLANIGERKVATTEAPAEAEPAGPTAVLVSGLPPAGKKMASIPPSASGDLAAIGDREVATPEAPKDPGSYHSQHITYTASRGNIPASTGNTTAQLSRSWPAKGGAPRRRITVFSVSSGLFPLINDATDPGGRIKEGAP
jgi:hypothetical protein